MPGFLFHAGAIVTCAHPPGPATIPAPSQARVLVSGLPVAVLPDAFVVTGCALTGTAVPPCTTIRWVNVSARVKVMGMPVLLQAPPAGSGNAICVGPPVPPPVPIVITMQQRVAGM
jgi:hypothetical protein